MLVLATDGLQLDEMQVLNTIILIKLIRTITSSYKSSIYIHHLYLSKAKLHLIKFTI